MGSPHAFFMRLSPVLREGTDKGEGVGCSEGGCGCRSSEVNVGA